jgi:hypothetical protein
MQTILTKFEIADFEFLPAIIGGPMNVTSGTCSAAGAWTCSRARR